MNFRAANLTNGIGIFGKVINNFSTFFYYHFIATFASENAWTDLNACNHV